MLTDIQRTVLRLVLRGYNDHEISSSMGISYRSVRYHIKNIRNIFKVNTDRQLVLVLAKLANNASFIDKQTMAQ